MDNQNYEGFLFEAQIPENEVRQFVQKKADYYIEKWEKAQYPQIYAGWNWAAYFCGFGWLGYRQMYKTLCLFLLIFWSIVTVLIVFDLFKLVQLLNFVFPLIIGFFGNALYYNSMKSKIKKIKANSIDTKDICLYSEGGTSWNGVYIGLVVWICLFLVSLFFTSLFAELTFPYRMIK